jgi:cobalt/nickel transport system permease protein
MDPKFIRVLGNILQSDSAADKNGTIWIFPVQRLVLAVFCILLCALSKNAVFTVTVIAVELVRTALLPGERIAGVLRRPLLAAAFTALIMIPAAVMGYPATLGNVTLKVFESVLVLVLLNERVSWKDLTGAFSALHLPDVFVYTLDSTVRYLVILGRFCTRLSEAVRLRTFRKTNWRKSGAGGIMGTVILKSNEMTSAQYEAMICRGFRGSYHISSLRRRRWKDLNAAGKILNLLYACLFPALLLLFFAAR